ncbi:hypothetical protein NQ317_010357 [Molorchus minor]|uniref:Uncharacterized protein n=1 Tax=Molorchus minor TaxID=1323400 RepID=A0ABQ9IW35_9CUCU|nr:hypothetical protein NQ317_010357 [Molorchus minor]
MVSSWNNPATPRTLFTEKGVLCGGTHVPYEGSPAGSSNLSGLVLFSDELHCSRYRCVELGLLG